MNVDEMQKKLSQKAGKEPEHPFEDLYGLLCHEVWLRVAANKTLSNTGSRTAGIDTMTKSHFLGDFEGYISRLHMTLKARTFEPMPVRRVYIPKPNSEKKRPLGIPTLLDRIVQEALRMILEPIWEADFSIHSYGFRPNRSTYDAMTYLGKQLTGNGGAIYQWVIEGDIESYFDTIPHRRLIKAVKKRVADRDIRDLLWKFLRAGVMHRGNVEDTLTGTPQGGIVSPLLANIYLHTLDKYMESRYLKLSEWQRRQRRAQGKGNYLYVRYADDFVVLCNGTKAEALAMKEELKGLLSTLGLTLSEDKTKVTHITEGFTFLGYRVIRSIGTKGKMIPKVLIPEKAIKRYCGEIRRRLAPSSTDESTSTIIMGLNRLTRGWCEYYRSTNDPAKMFNKVGTELFWDMAHWLGRKYALRMPAVMQRFRKGHTFGTSMATLVMPTEYKAKRFVAKTWHNPYTDTEMVKREKARIRRESLPTYNHIWNGNEDRQGTGDLREEVILRKGTVCALNMPDICASKGKPLHPSEVEVDHIIPRTRFKDLTKADSMDNLQPVCTPCHRAKTKSDLRVLSRMR